MFIESQENYCLMTHKSLSIELILIFNAIHHNIFKCSEVLLYKASLFIFYRYEQFAKELGLTDKQIKGAFKRIERNYYT